MQFYTKRQSPQNLFFNIGDLQNSIAFRTIQSIRAKLSGQDAGHNKKRKPYLYIDLALQACIVLPLTFIGALIRDLANIVRRGLTIAINLVLDAVNIATKVLTVILQLGALGIEKGIVNPVAWAYNKLCSKKPDGGQGPDGDQPEGAVPDQLVPADAAVVGANPKAEAEAGKDEYEPLANEQRVRMDY